MHRLAFRRAVTRTLVSGCLACSLAAAGPGSAAEPEIIARGFGYVEGPIFVAGTLYFVDYNSSRVLRMVNGQVQTVWHEDGCGANGLVELSGALLVACYDSGVVAMISTDGKLLQRIDQDRAGHRFVAPNDLAADAHGGVYFSASGSGDAVLGSVFYRRADGVVEQVADGIRSANGLVVSLDGHTLYVAQTRDQRLLAFTIAADGSLAGRRLDVDLATLLKADSSPVHMPDGVRMDRHGNLFIGLFNGGGFAVLDATGKLVTMIHLPGTHHASLAISPDGRSVYATAVFEEPGANTNGEILRVANPVIE
jgi:gluconolactonase